MVRFPALSMLVLLASCGSAAPELASNGPALDAALSEELPLRGGPGREAAFSKDGSLLAASNAAGRIEIRRTPDLRLVRLLYHRGGAAALAFSQEGQFIVSGGYDGTARVWEVASGRLLHVLRGSKGTIWSADVSPDGNSIVTGGEDGLVRIWDRQGRLVRALKGHELNVWRVRFSPDGRRIASGSFDRSVKVWDSHTGALLHDLQGHQQAVVGLDFSPNGQLIASGSDDSTIRIWRADSGRLVRSLENGDHVYTLSFSSDGRWLASGGRARGALGTFWHQLAGGGGVVENVRLWRVADGRAVAALPHPEDVMSVAIAPDGLSLATSAEDGVARIWRLKERR